MNVTSFVQIRCFCCRPINSVISLKVSVSTVGLQRGLEGAAAFMLIVQHMTQSGSDVYNTRTTLHYWAHSMGPWRSRLSRVVVVVVVDIARRLRYSYSWRATSDTW